MRSLKLAGLARTRGLQQPIRISNRTEWKVGRFRTASTRTIVDSDCFDCGRFRIDFRLTNRPKGPLKTHLGLFQGLPAVVRKALLAPARHFWAPFKAHLQGSSQSPSLRQEGKVAVSTVLLAGAPPYSNYLSSTAVLKPTRGSCDGLLMSAAVACRTLNPCAVAHPARSCAEAPLV